MKKQLFFIATLFLLVGILACNNDQPANAPNNTNGPQDLHSLDHVNGEMDSTKAMAAIKLWDKLRPDIKAALVRGGATQDTSRVPIAFYVPIQDILSLASKSANTNQLYAMLAFEADSMKLSLIFRAPDEKGQLRYYDFTEPCPPCAVSMSAK